MCVHTADIGVMNRGGSAGRRRGSYESRGMDPARADAPSGSARSLLPSTPIGLKRMIRPNGKAIRRVRVLSIPGRRHAQNSYFRLLWDALEKVGLQMIGARTTAALTLRYDIFHVHLPELLVERPIHSAAIWGLLFLAYVALAKATHKKIVWTIHEVTPTIPRLLTKPFLWCMRRLAGAYVFMNRTSEDEFFRRYPAERQKAVARIPHSSYPVAKISTDRRRAVRASITDGADCLVVGFPGEIKPYKNAAALRHLPRTDYHGRPLFSIVAGTLHRSCDIATTEGMFRAMPQLRRMDQRLTDEGLSELIQSIDLVFLPYLRGWNSGLAMFALGCGCRLLCSALPMFTEIAEKLGPPWVFVFDHRAADLSQELTAAVARASQHTPSAADQVRLAQFLAATSFEQAAVQHLDLYRNLMAGR